MALTEDQTLWLRRIGERGHWPVSPFLRSTAATPLMRMGLIELVKPPAPYLPYARLTTAGREKLATIA